MPMMRSKSRWAKARSEGSKALSSAASTYFRKIPSLSLAAVAPAKAEELNDLSSFPPRSSTKPTLNCPASEFNDRISAAIGMRQNLRCVQEARRESGPGTSGIGSYFRWADLGGQGLVSGANGAGTKNGIDHGFSGFHG